MILENIEGGKDMAIVVKNSPYIMGIDLGTSNSAIAAYLRGNAEIIPIDGDNTCPAVVNVRDNGEIIVGRQARSRMMIDPDNTVPSIKRQMGTEWKKEFAGLAGKEYTPQDLSAEILNKLIMGAQEAGTIELRGTPKYVVICTPANFNDSQKQATREAGALANLDVLYLLEEPIAAAIAYGMDRERDQTILVYDLGGGTFDVSILKIDSATEGPSQFKVLAKAGVNQLGGDDFDMEIMRIVADKFLTSSNVDIMDIKKDQGISVKSLREAQQKLKDAAERAKMDLTEAQTATISIPNLIKDESGNVHNVDLEISRKEFNEAIRPLIMQSKEAIQRALDEGSITIEDISRIVLVGGSTRVPLVKEMLTEMFGKEPYSDANPDVIVARGAAIFGATLGVPAEKINETEEIRDEDQPDTTITINNIVTHFLGIEVSGGKFNCLLDKGLEIPQDLPLSVSKEYTTQRDNQTEIMIRVYQSEISTEYVNENGVQCIGEFFLTGIPPKSRGQERITVAFSIDQQNLLKVEASSSGSKGALDIQRS